MLTIFKKRLAKFFLPNNVTKRVKTKEVSVIVVKINIPKLDELEKLLEKQEQLSEELVNNAERIAALRLTIEAELNNQ